MDTRLRLPFATVLSVISTMAYGQDLNAFLIVKEPDAHPMVSAEMVESVGASNVLTILGEEYVVTTPEVLQAYSFATTVEPVTLPGTGIPGVPPGILPTCQCPEGYVAGLVERLGSADVIFAPIETSAEPSQMLQLLDDPNSRLNDGLGPNITIVPVE